MSCVGIFIERSIRMVKSNLRKLTECAIMVAAATVLSFIKIYKLPLGGAITLVSMLPILLAGYRNGIKFGFIASFTYAIIQLLIEIGEIASWGLTPIVFIGSILFDYIFAFGCLGLGGLFSKNKYGLIISTATALPIRFIMHFISGYLLFGTWAGEGYSAFTWSIVYNGSFMLPEFIITLIVAIIISQFPIISGYKNTKASK